MMVMISMMIIILSLIMIDDLIILLISLCINSISQISQDTMSAAARAKATNILNMAFQIASFIAVLMSVILSYILNIK